jgi:AcrR family transcriptional regulator
MYKLCKTEQSAKRQREIEAALFELIKKRNYEDVTVTELCEEMEMPRKTFYRYFDCKDDALFALIEHTLAEYMSFNAPSVKAPRTLARELERFFSFWHEKREFLDTFAKNNMLSQISECAIKFPLFDSISISRFLPDEDDTTREKIFEFTICGLIFLVLEWYHHGFDTSIEDMAKLSCRMISQPLFPDLDKIGIRP